MRPSKPMSAPPLAQPLPWGEVPVLEGGEDNGVRPSRTLCTHLTNPRRVRRGGGPAFRGRGGGRSHLPGAPGFFLLSRPGPPRLLESSASGLRPAAPQGPGGSAAAAPRGPARGPSAAECKERPAPSLALSESRPEPLAPSRAHLPPGRETRGHGGPGSGATLAAKPGGRRPLPSAALRACV